MTCTGHQMAALISIQSCHALPPLLACEEAAAQPARWGPAAKRCPCTDKTSVCLGNCSRVALRPGLREGTANPRMYGANAISSLCRGMRPWSRQGRAGEQQYLEGEAEKVMASCSGLDPLAGKRLFQTRFGQAACAPTRRETCSIAADPAWSAGLSVRLPASGPACAVLPPGRAARRFPEFPGKGVGPRAPGGAAR